jgi:hypothetical protein
MTAKLVVVAACALAVATGGMLASTSAAPVQCLKPDGTPEPCESRQSTPSSGKPRSPVPPPTIPPEYDHPFDGKVHIMEGEFAPSELERFCNQNGNTIGCALTTWIPHRCFIAIGAQIHLKEYGFTRKSAIRHAIAYCNGWRPNPPE